jgi:hypothetical protein
MFIHDLLERVWPLTINHSLPFCEYEVGDLFEETTGVYRLLERDSVKVKIVHWNWWTKLWWSGTIKNTLEDRTQVLTHKDIFKRKG